MKLENQDVLLLNFWTASLARMLAQPEACHKVRKALLISVDVFVKL